MEVAIWLALRGAVRLSSATVPSNPQKPSAPVDPSKENRSTLHPWKHVLPAFRAMHWQGYIRNAVKSRRHRVAFALPVKLQMAGSGEAKNNNTKKTEKPPKICMKNTIPMRPKEWANLVNWSLHVFLELVVCFCIFLAKYHPTKGNSKRNILAIAIRK